MDKLTDRENKFMNQSPMHPAPAKVLTNLQGSFRNSLELEEMFSLLLWMLFYNNNVQNPLVAVFSISTSQTIPTITTPIYYLVSTMT